MAALEEYLSIKERLSLAKTEFKQAEYDLARIPELFGHIDRAIKDLRQVYGAWVFEGRMNQVGTKEYNAFMWYQRLIQEEKRLYEEEKSLKEIIEKYPENTKNIQFEMNKLQSAAKAEAKTAIDKTTSNLSNITQEKTKLLSTKKTISDELQQITMQIKENRRAESGRLQEMVAYDNRTTIGVVLGFFSLTNKRQNNERKAQALEESYQNLCNIQDQLTRRLMEIGPKIEECSRQLTSLTDEKGSLDDLMVYMQENASTSQDIHQILTVEETYVQYLDTSEEEPMSDDSSSFKPF